jgi:acetylornithine deacetylase/succinyl-diaminopimelate desuccinylase family protein
MKQKICDSVEKMELNITDMTMALIRFKSENPPGNEEEIAEFLASKFEDLGFKVELVEAEPKRPNVIATLDGEQGFQTLIFNGHMDVVPAGPLENWEHPPYEPILRDGRIYGRGAADMKGALSAVFNAAKAIIELGIRLKGKLVIQFVADEEEGGAKGTEFLIKKGLVKGDYVIVCEPTSLKVGVAEKGFFRAEVTVRGKAAHSSTPSEGINAIVKMCKVIKAIDKELVKKFAGRSHPLLGSPTISIGTITGGVKVNVIPDKCTIKFDRRLIPGENPETAFNEIIEILKSLKERDHQLKYEVKLLGTAKPSELSPQAEIVKLLEKSYEFVFYQKPIIYGLMGTTDARFFINHAKIPTVIFGPGGISETHKVNEFVRVRELISATKIYSLMIFDVLAVK